MLTYEKAKEKLLGDLNSTSVGAAQGGVVILDEETIEKPYGWVLFYNSRRFVETKDLMYSLIGSGPVIVLAATGELIRLGSARSDAVQIEEFERQRGLVST